MRYHYKGQNQSLSSCGLAKINFMFPWQPMISFTENSAFPFSISLQVRYAETDQMQFAHHANYFVWFEMARVAYCDYIGLPYREMEAQGVLLPVVEASCRFRSPARFDDPLLIELSVIQKTRRTLKIGYRVSRGTALLAEGETTHVVMGTDGKARSFPPEMLSRF